jgi:hypothetical protein
MSEYPRLAHLMRSYFHQDYDIEGDGSILGVLAHFAVAEEPEAVDGVVTDIDQLLRSNPTEQERARVYEALYDGWADFDPRGAGVSITRWFFLVQGALTHTRRQTGR